MGRVQRTPAPVPLVAKRLRVVAISRSVNTYVILSVTIVANAPVVDVAPMVTAAPWRMVAHEEAVAATRAMSAKTHATRVVRCRLSQAVECYNRMLLRPHGTACSVRSDSKSAATERVENNLSSARR